MTKAHAANYFASAVLAGVFGLLGAGVPRLVNEHQHFSWVGFSVGAGTTLLAMALVRSFREGNKPPKTVPMLRRTLMGLGTSLFLASVFLFSLTIHTQWLWPRNMIGATIVAGAVTFVILLLTSWFDPDRQA